MSNRNVFRAVRDMALADGRLVDSEEEILELIAKAEGLTPEEVREAMAGDAIPLDQLETLIPDRADRVKLLELSVLVALADGQESVEETDRMREITDRLGLSKAEVLTAVDSAHQRMFDFSRDRVP